ncbi:hypothetical protein PLIIFM63780_007923 [Purpureocillium lilacinum]|nr:hypothetical protein PLIIFM63780_007923 [Purpureocillium lilacinum]
MRFSLLDGYFKGIKAIVKASELVPEHPRNSRKRPPRQSVPKHEDQKPEIYSPYDAATNNITQCYLDISNSTPVPNIYAYRGIPQQMPSPAIGSYDLLGIRSDVCFDRFGRYGPYGFGYRKAHGGSGVGLDTENSGSDAVWAQTGQIDYGNINWSDAQERCFASNRHRFDSAPLGRTAESINRDNKLKRMRASNDDEQRKEKVNPRSELRHRSAVVVRLYTGFQWTELAILNLRAMISELSLNTGGEYAVHLLLQVHNTDLPIWSDDETLGRLLQAHVPVEFHGLVSVWSESEMTLYYPGAFDAPLANPSERSAHGFYRSGHLPLQVFAMDHPQYSNYWNWEVDIRVVGSYYEFFDRMGRWADEQPRRLLWERNARYYIPSYHGSWDNFSRTAHFDTKQYGRPDVFGPVAFPGQKRLRHEKRQASALPANCIEQPEDCGVGEAADLITLNPIFDTVDSGWIFSDDITGYPGASPSEPPRRCAIVTASRLSGRLLKAMHEEVWRHHHTMFSEMFPPTIALHHGFKAVYAPHPVYLDRAWYPVNEIDAVFNSGAAHSTSGIGSPFDQKNEHNFKGSTWYYNSEFAGLLWRRWLGYAQTQPGRRSSSIRGAMTSSARGGFEEESDEGSSGRMCLRSMIVHPIKHEGPGDV